MFRRKLLFGLFLVLVVFFLIGREVYLFDTVTSVIPGWHTTIYSPWQVGYGILLFVIFLLSLITFLKIMKKLFRKR